MPRAWERFEKIRLLGRGSFGQAWLVVDHGHGNDQVVIKVPVDDNAEELLVNEVMKNAHLRASLEGARHPDIVRFLDVVKFEGRFSMLMEFVPNAQELRKVIGPIALQRQPMEVEEALGLLEHACRGLKAAHDAKLVHRDIKPENMLVQEDGVLKLLDFGLGRISQSTGSAKTTVGTYPYMAPEMYQPTGPNAPERDERIAACDVWSLSVTAYEMLTGRLPFWADNIGQLMRLITDSEPRRPMDMNPRVSRRLNEFLLKGLHKSSQLRYANGGEMLAQLMVIRAGLEGEIQEARRQFQAGHQDSAIAALSSLFDECPENASICLALSRLHNERWDFRESERVLRRGLQRNRDNQQLHVTLAAVLGNLGKKDEAEAERRLATRLTTTDKNTRS